MVECEPQRHAVTRVPTRGDVVSVPLQKSRRRSGSGALVRWGGDIGDEGKRSNTLPDNRVSAKRKATRPVYAFAARGLAPRVQVPRKAKRSRFSSAPARPSFPVEARRPSNTRSALD